ncbi:histidine kinase [Desulfovibrio mangrovi]|uniref:histidine kinase n=1 Tax=Desulfovibrio mangrovi TaxID=2976983 RepID=UPI0022462E65|nr:histidine kinase [Desulfovibrio mangrovi]UZP66088.1 histidine kinase [Desulfovibrio mangrovi]
MHDDDQIEEFMGELYDKFYPQVMDGLERMKEGDVHSGIENLSRPLHTIKGVTGFMGGFEVASGFTHKVESFLKKIQAGDVALDDAVTSAAITSVNMIFQVIEQIRDTGSGPQGEMDEVLARISELSEPKGQSKVVVEEGVRLSVVDGVIVASVVMSRVHLPAQKQMLLDVLQKQGAGVPLVLDFSGVLSVSSSVWDALEPFAEKFPVHVAGMQPFVGGLFHSWGYGAIFTVHPSVEAFFGQDKAGGGDA